MSWEELMSIDGSEDEQSILLILKHPLHIQLVRDTFRFSMLPCNWNPIYNIKGCLHMILFVFIYKFNFTETDS